MYGSIGQNLRQSGRFEEGIEEERVQYQRRNMMREDFEGLFYRKLNYIVLLEESEQAYHQRQILMISHREHKYSEGNFSGRDATLDIHPVTFLAKQTVNRISKLKKQSKIRKREAEIKIDMGKLQLDRKCLLEQIHIFIDKLKEIAHQYYSEQNYGEAEHILLQHGKKYNLATTIATFIKQIQQITTHNIIYQCLKVSLKKTNIEKCRPLKLQDLKLSFYQQKSKKELLDLINLYLKQFRSVTVFKQLSDILTRYVQLYDKVNLSSHYLYNKLIQEIINNLQHLSTISRNLDDLHNNIKDLRIQIQILSEENKIAEGQMHILQENSSLCIAEEAAYLAREYEQGRYNHNQLFSSRQQGSFYTYFHEQLKKKYQQFLQNQLEDAEHIYLLKEKIQDQTEYLQKLKQYLQEKQVSPSSQLQTHRSVEESIYSEFNYTLKENSSRNTPFPNHQNRQQPLNEHDRNIIKKYSLRQSNGQKFLVRRQFKIRKNGKSINGKICKSDKLYEVKVTKKYLIFQQTTSNSLRLNEKVEIQRIKGYKQNIQQHSISLDCGHNQLQLLFISNNTSSFINKIYPLFNHTSKQNRKK